MLKATFIAALLVLLMTTATLLVNFVVFLDLAQMRIAVAETEKRVAALEVMQAQPRQAPIERGQLK